MTVATYRFEDDGRIPNSPLPVLIYRDVGEARDAAACEELFAGTVTSARAMTCSWLAPIPTE